MSTPPSDDVCGWSCEPAVSVAEASAMFGSTLVATVQHASDCPWLATVAPEGEAVVPTPWGILIHCAADV